MSKQISLSLPRIGLSCLLLCLLSGIILSFYYRPFGNVFKNVEEITSRVPYGFFFRQFHYGTGQLFVILMLVHTLDYFIKKRYRVYAPREWARMMTSLCLCFFTLFTGFILKGDKEGLFAGQIFMNIMQTIPQIGEPFSKLFIEPGEGFFFLPYLYHCFFVPLFIILLIRPHIREWLPNEKFVIFSFTALSLFALAIKPQMDIPPESNVAMVKGPWFFLGIQTLLKSVPAFWAGLGIPFLFLGLLLLLPVLRNPMGKILHYFVLICFFVYGILVIRASIWSP